MNLYLTRAEAVESEIAPRLAEGLEDLLPEPADDGTYPTVNDYYDVDAIAEVLIELFVYLGGRGLVYYCKAPDVIPSTFWDIAERHARPVSEE